MPPDEPPGGALGLTPVGRPGFRLGGTTGTVGRLAPGTPTVGSCTPPTLGATLMPGSCIDRPPAGGSVATTTLPIHWLDALRAMPYFLAALPSRVIGLPGSRHSRFTAYADQVNWYVPAFGKLTFR